MPEGQSKRTVLPKRLQLTIFRRDGWLCCWCKKPVIFAPAMKFLECELRNGNHDGKLAYYHARWTRNGSPLLDELGAVIDHIVAFSTGGLCDEENLATSCNKCNGHKSSATLDHWKARTTNNPIKGKYGEPQHWDGLSNMFVMMAERNPEKLTVSERGWLKAFVSSDYRHGAA